MLVIDSCQFTAWRREHCNLSVGLIPNYAPLPVSFKRFRCEVIERGRNLSDYCSYLRVESAPAAIEAGC